MKWATESRAKAKEGAQKILSAVVDNLKNLPSKLLSIGKDLVSGLWNGINDKLKWLKDKISGFASSVLDGIKSFFGVNSPSKETAWVGEMLDEGLAKGVLDHADDPLDAMRKLSDGMLDEATGMNGLTLERKLQHTFAAPDAAVAANMTISDKLEKILTAIERGQVIALDGKQLVGGTATLYDNALGQRRLLAARGAI